MRGSARHPPRTRSTPEPPQQPAKPPPAASALPIPGVVEARTPKRVVPVTGEQDALKTVFASVIILIGMDFPLDQVRVECRTTDGKVLAGEMPEPLPAGASVGIPAWPTVVADVQGRTWAPVLEACGLTKVVTGRRQALAPEGRLLTTVAAADFKDSPS